MTYPVLTCWNSIQCLGKSFVEHLNNRQTSAVLFVHATIKLIKIQMKIKLVEEVYVKKKPKERSKVPSIDTMTWRENYTRYLQGEGPS